MIPLRELQVRPGDPVLPAWQRLLEWAKQHRLHAGAGVRLIRTPDGTHVTADLKARPWSHPFRVTLTEGEAGIRPGTVNSLMPWLGDRPLDGSDGEESGRGKQNEPPRLPLDGEPGEDLRSWVVVDVRAGDRGEIDPEDPEALTIRHVASLKPEEAEVGRHPLAMLLWDEEGESILRARQITHFHLQHLHLADREGEGPGRHLFWAT